MLFSVAIDGFRLITEPLGSIALYTSELVRSLCVLSEIQNLQIFLPRKPNHEFIYNKLLDFGNVEFIYPTNDVFPERSFRSEMFWIQLVIIYLIRTKCKSIDYYIAPYHHPPIFLSKTIRTITVIHDLCGLRA